MSTLRRRDAREEIWDDELELEAKCDNLDAEFGRRDEEDGTVTARSPYGVLSRFAPANPSPPPMPFSPSAPFPRFPTAAVFSVPNEHSYLFVVDPCCLRFPLVPNVQPRLVAPFAAYTQRTREDAVKEEELSLPRRENQVGRYGWPVFVLG